MSDPTLSPYPFYYYTCDRDPTASEPLIFNNYPGFMFFWWNTTSNDIFINIVSTTDSMVWEKYATSSNIESVLLNAGWNLNTSRSYSLRSSPAFNTSYSPSSTNDCYVICVVSVTSTLLTPGTVLFQSNDSGSFLTIGEASVSGVAASSSQTISCIIPANKSYKLLNSSGTASIISINELLF